LSPKISIFDSLENEPFQILYDYFKIIFSTVRKKGRVCNIRISKNKYACFYLISRKLLLEKRKKKPKSDIKYSATSMIVQSAQIV
jgi:hypothetical protein